MQGSLPDSRLTTCSKGRQHLHVLVQQLPVYIGYLHNVIDNSVYKISADYWHVFGSVAWT